MFIVFSQPLCENLEVFVNMEGKRTFSEWKWQLVVVLFAVTVALSAMNRPKSDIKSERRANLRYTAASNVSPWIADNDVAGIFSWKPRKGLKYFVREKRIFVVECTNNILKVANERKIPKDEKNVSLDLSMRKFRTITEMIPSSTIGKWRHSNSVLV